MRVLVAAYRQAFAGISREVWLLAMALLVNRAGAMVLPFLSLYLTHDLGVSAVRAGQIIGCFGLGSMAGSYLGGWLSDRYSPLGIQQISLVLSGLGYLLFTRLESFGALAVGVFVLATVADAFRPALMVSVAQHSPPSANKRCFALIRLAANLGMGIGPAAAGLLAHYGYFWLFVGDAVTCWLAALLLFLLLGTASDGDGVSEHEDERTGRSPWRDGPYLAFLMLVMILAMAFFQVWTTVPLYLRSAYAASERAIGALLSLNALLIAFTEMLVIRAVESFDPLKTVGAGALLVGLGLALLPLGPPFAVAIAAMVVLTVGEMLALPISNATVADRAGKTQVGRYMGSYSLAFAAAFVVGPVVGTAVFQHLGPSALWYGLGGVGVALGGGFALLSGPLRRAR